MFLENEHQPIISHSPYDLARPMDHVHHHHHTTANHIQTATERHQTDDSEGRSTVSSPTSIISYRDLSGCEDFDAKMPIPSSGPGSAIGSVGGNNNNNNNNNSNNNNNKEQKPKKHKCKHCGMECTEKVQYWKHIRTHIKPEQLLECPNCEFATDLKHHYEYHLLNHTGAKPFTCTDCDYKCVSKSMLQSHLKSHSNVFQFQCYDCGYASKYMHSLKQHLKKRDHRPATPLNPDGTPNPEIVIDVVGNRRGPRQNKKQGRQHPYHQLVQPSQQQQQQQQQQQDDGGSSSGGHPSPYSMQQLLQLQPSSGVAGPAAYPTSAAESLMYSMMTKRTMEIVDYQSEYLAIQNNNNNSTAVDDKMEVVQNAAEREYNNYWNRHRQHYHHHHHHRHQYHADDVVKVEMGEDLQMPEPPVQQASAVALVEPPKVPQQQQQQAAAVPALAETGPLNLSKDSVAPRAAGSSRRKGIACKLERPFVERAQTSSAVAAVAVAEETSAVVVQQQQWMAALKDEQVSSVQRSASPDKTPRQRHRHQSSSPEKDEEATHACHHCDIIFKENIMYSMHMGFHSFRNPFACNLCGEIMNDKFSFFAHIARVPHS